MSVQHPDEPTEFEAALQTILPVGTTVASTYVEKGVDTVNGSWPALVIQCPKTDHDVVAIGPTYRATFHVKATYLDRWESSTRTFEQITADAKTAVFQMLRNVRATPTLGFIGTEATPQSSVEIAEGPVQVEGLGFPLVAAIIDIEILGPYFT